MKVITIKQPFATLIAKGYKRFEFRTWRTKYRGNILIHAGKGIDKKAMERYRYLNLTYPSGCIIAKANLVDCIKIDEQMREVLKKENADVYGSVIKHTEWDGFGFALEDVVELEPIYLNGKLSLWEYEGEIHEKNN